MNLPGWFWSGVASLRSPGARYTRADLHRYRSLGIRGVRIPIDPELLAPAFPRLDDRIVDILVKRIETCLDVGLTVIVDGHNGVPEPAAGGLSHRLQHDRAHRLAFGQFWERLASRLARISAEGLLLEPVNEPLFTEPDGTQAIWTDEIAPTLVQTIRSGAPDHTIVLAGPNAAATRHLHQFDPAAVGDGNIVYSIHMYEPYAFTHQGASWATTAFSTRQTVPYPGAPGAESCVVEAELDRAIDWAAEQAVPMIVTEFGAYHAAPSPDRLAWTRAVRAHVERRGVPWMAWTDRSGFGFEREDGSLDPEMLAALGLSGH